MLNSKNTKLIVDKDFNYSFAYIMREIRSMIKSMNIKQKEIKYVKLNIKPDVGLHVEITKYDGLRSYFLL